MRISERSLGWYVIYGALAGGAVTVWASAHGAPVVGNSLEVASIPFALTCAAGTALLRAAPRARQLGYLTQALQIPIIVLPAVTWKFTSGVIASLALNANGPYLFGGLAAEWLFGTGNLNGVAPTVGLNFAPLLVIVLIERSRGQPSVG